MCIQTKAEHISGKLSIMIQSKNAREQMFIPNSLLAIERASTFSPFRSINLDLIDGANFQNATVEDIFKHPDLSSDVARLDAASTQQLCNVFDRHLAAASWWTYPEGASPPSVPHWWMNPTQPLVSVRSKR